MDINGLAVVGIVTCLSGMICGPGHKGPVYQLPPIATEQQCQSMGGFPLRHPISGFGWVCNFPSYKHTQWLPTYSGWRPITPRD